MKLMPDMHIFICENDEAAQEIVGKYFKRGIITMAQVADASMRQQVINAIDDITEVTKRKPKKP